MALPATRKQLLCFLIFLLPAFRAFAGDTLVVAPHFYHVDYQQKLILVNQNIAELNAEGEHSNSHLLLDSLYVFEQQPTLIETSTSYQVRLASANAALPGAAYTLYFTQLPVVHVAARSPIVDTPSVYARFSLADAATGFLTANIGIEIRGGISQGFPKKSYELSFWGDTTGATSQDVHLGTMRTNDKWNLQAMYNEPMRIRSKSANALWQEMDTLYYHALEPDAKNGIAMTYVEVFVNEHYNGLYALTERIDRKQLKLKKYSNGITGELYKGSSWDGAVTFTSLPPYDNSSDIWGGFEYKHPDEKVDWANLYDFVDFVEHSSDSTFYHTYQQRFDLANAVDYFIFLNLVRATDNTGKNLYIARYKAGEPYFYVPWDLDGVFGTDWTGQNSTTTDDLLDNGFYTRLWQDCSPAGFRATLQRRWAQLRTTVLTEKHIGEKFEANSTYLTANNVYEREHLAWNDFAADTTQVPYMTAWLRSRLAYLDSALVQRCSGTAVTLPDTVVVTPPVVGPVPVPVQMYPNPVSDFLYIEHDATASEVSIRDLLGKIVVQVMLTGTRTKIDLQNVARGMYLVSIKTDKSNKTMKLLVN